MVIHLFTAATDEEPGEWVFVEDRVRRQNSAKNPYATQYLRIQPICELIAKSVEVSGCFSLTVVTLGSFQVGNLIEQACKLLTVRQESYIKVATELTELASFQVASAAGAFEPEPEGRLMEQHRYVRSLPIPHALLEHGSGRQGGLPVGGPAPTPTAAEDAIRVLMRTLPAFGKLQEARVTTSAEGASGPATSSEAVSGRASPAQSEAGSAFGVG